MAEVADYFLNLEELKPEDKERYYVVVGKTDYIKEGDDSEAYFIVSGAACIPTYDIDSSEIVNEFLEDYCGENADEQGFYDPLVFYGEICLPASLEEETMDDYFLFVPEHDGNFIIGYKMYIINTIEVLVSDIESIMKDRLDLEIEDLIVFRGEEIPLSMQISPTFDQTSVDQMLGDRDA